MFFLFRRLILIQFSSRVINDLQSLNKIPLFFKFSIRFTIEPSILIPFPASADQHQELNAAYMARYGGAVIVNQHNPEKDILKNTITNLIDSESLSKMKSNMNNYKCLNPVNQLFEIINMIS